MSETKNEAEATQKPSILHISTRDILRPIRDQILRVAGYDVVSCNSHAEGLRLSHQSSFDLVLIDVNGEREVIEAQMLCSAIKAANDSQRVAYVCNWRVSVSTECPDEVVRTEFDPMAFVSGVTAALQADPT